MHSSRMRTSRSSSHLLGGLSQCMLGFNPPGPGPGYPPVVGLDTLPGVGLDTPKPDPPTSPLGLGLDTHPGQTPNLPLGLGLDPPARPQNLPAGPGLDTPPPVNRMTDRCKNITFANFVCGR